MNLFIEMLDRLESEEHYLVGVPPCFLVAFCLLKLIKTGVLDEIGIMMLLERTGMYENTQEILAYCYAEPEEAYKLAQNRFSLAKIKTDGNLLL